MGRASCASVSGAASGHFDERRHPVQAANERRAANVLPDDRAQVGGVAARRAAGDALLEALAPDGRPGGVAAAAARLYLQ